MSTRAIEGHPAGASEPRSEASVSRLSRPALVAGVIVLIAVALSWPMLTTSSGFSQDWPNHLWFLWQQALNIERDGLPSLFVTQGSSIFYPFYAFYGGTLYALGGLLSVVLGGAPVKAYVLTYVIGFCAALGAFYWLARAARVSRGLALVPGVVFVTSSYVLTDVYARGAWPEFIAVCSIPVVAASGLSILREQRLRPVPAAVLALATVVLFGSHNITMLYGVTFLSLVGLTALATVPASRSLVTRRGVLRVAVVVVPAIMVDAWFLIPALSYGSRTVAGHGENLALLRATSELVDAKRLFTFSRASSTNGTSAAPGAPDFALSLPLLAIAWTVVAALVCRVRERGSPMLRLTWILIAWGVVFALLMTHLGLIEALPKPYQFVQFQYRIETYVLLALSGAMIGPLSVLSSGGRPRGGRRILLLGLIPVLVLAVEGAVVQIAAYPAQVPDRNVVFAASQQPPTTMYSMNDYYDESLPVVPAPPVTLYFPPPAISGDHITLPYPPSLGGALVESNLLAAPYLVSVNGAKVVGRTPDGRMVMRLSSPRGAGGSVTLSRSDRVPVVLGRWVSLLGLVLLVATLVALSVGALLRRRRGGPVQAGPYQST
jgi:hypothetical protein